MKKCYHYLIFLVYLFCSLPSYTQAIFKPTLWLYNPIKTIDSQTQYPTLNFNHRLAPAKTIGTSAKKLESSGHVFVVYQASKNENLINLISNRKALFLDSKLLKINDTVDLNGYNEPYGELLDIKYGGMDSGKFWMNTQMENSGVYEVILLDNKTTTKDINEIRTYLGLKYGIDLINYKQYTYKDKELWNGSNDTYNYRIFGVAKFNFFNLMPTKSVHSKDKDLIISVSNRQKRIFDDGAYILFGNNNKSFVFDNKTKRNHKEWLVQTNRNNIKVDVSFPLSKLGKSKDSFNEYELQVSNKEKNIKKYTGNIRDTLLIFKNISFSSDSNSIISLKEYTSDFKLDIDKDCDHIHLQIKGFKGVNSHRIKILDEEGKIVINESSQKKKYSLPNTNTSYYDITLEYNHKKLYKRISTIRNVLIPKDLHSSYTLTTQPIELHLENPNRFTYNWFKDNQPIGIGNGILINEEGTYSLTVTNDNTGCSITQSFLVNTSHEIDQWRVFPNPAQSSEPVYVAFDLEEKSKVNIALYQSNGQLIRTFFLGDIDKKTVTLDSLNLSDGVYILVAYINEIPQIKKIIIK